MVCKLLCSGLRFGIVEYANFRVSDYVSENLIFFHNIPFFLDVLNHHFHTEFDFESSTIPNSIP
uniref:Putative ovule protein n=1 Tax=Solanum chacoense TaxID=4108 RepID=A0A0V0H732_SOLCH